MTHQTAPDAIAFCTNLLRECAATGASDIYLLPGRDKYIFRRRCNGDSAFLLEIDTEFGRQCINRLKVMAHMLTYRTNIAQDGAIRATPELGECEFRLASMPTLDGERMTIRIFRHGALAQTLDELAFAADTVTKLRDVLRARSGLIILTGPTGCGKSTTIYSMLRELLQMESDSSSIITVEDPVEQRIDGISQISLPRGDAEWNYAAALRAALRHDVKTLMIGEMRDREIVKVAMEAALTGHRVITTFHAGDIAGVFARLLHMEFEPFLIGAALNCVVAQRLVHSVDMRSRVPLAAMLSADDALRDLLAARPSLTELRQAIENIDGADLTACGAKLAATGIISPFFREEL